MRALVCLTILLAVIITINAKPQLGFESSEEHDSSEEHYHDDGQDLNGHDRDGNHNRKIINDGYVNPYGGRGSYGNYGIEIHPG